MNKTVQKDKMALKQKKYFVGREVPCHMPSHVIK
jgi:hypothetical protein